MSGADLPFAKLGRREWERLADAAALLTCILVMAFASYAVYVLYGQDFRGYYAAARVALQGGDPYDYDQVALVLERVTGYVGNNPFYYPPWFCVIMLPFALLPYGWARGLWIGANWALFIGGMTLTTSALGWPLRGWRRWLAWLSAFYLFGWVNLKFEQLGLAMFFCLAWALWALKRGRDVQAGLAMALLLTKPNVTLIAFALLALSLARKRRRVVMWALICLGLLAGVGSALFGGWMAQLADPNFGQGLNWLTDGPGRVVHRRRLCTFLSWLEGWGVSGPAAWVAYGGLAAVGLGAVWRSQLWWSDPVFCAALGTTIALLLTPYALLYDYSPLIVAQLWVYRHVARVSDARRWGAWAILAFMGSVLIWAGPEYDGYWLALGMGSLLALLSWGRTGV
jgi:hypothetical protein